MIYALDTFGNAKVNEFIVHEKLKGMYIISAVTFYEAVTGRVPYEYINSSWLIEDCLRSNRFTEIRLKSIGDLLMGAFFFLLTLPAVLVLALMVKLDSKGPAFFAQERVGRHGKSFKMYKIRTMQCVVPGCTLPNEAEGWHGKNETRITPLGAFMRRFHLDELPQFFNVLKGDMSIVGPRPEMEMFIKDCESKIPFYRLRLAIKPGITGWAQVRFHHTSTLQGYKKKFEYDLYYLSRLSVKLDLEIILRTVATMFSGTSR